MNRGWTTWESCNCALESGEECFRGLWDGLRVDLSLGYLLNCHHCVDASVDRC